MWDRKKMSKTKSNLNQKEKKNSITRKLFQHRVKNEKMK